MKKDLVVWVGCVLLFGAGVIWGLAWLKDDFFRVDNIHDLAEIGSSLATIGAVYIALTAWKKQIRAQADHDLARRILIASERLKKAAVSLIIDAQFCSRNSNLQYEDYAVIERVDAGISSRMSMYDEEESTLQALLLEARVVWDGEFDTLLDRVLTVSGRAYACNEHFLIFLRESGNPDLQEELEADILGFNERLKSMGMDKGPRHISKALDQLASSAEIYLKYKISI